MKYSTVRLEEPSYQEGSILISYSVKKGLAQPTHPGGSGGFSIVE
jgi:hypothetical protein